MIIDKGGTEMSNNTKTKKLASKSKNQIISKIIIYAILLLITAAMLVPFLWMLSASIKTGCVLGIPCQSSG